MERFLKIILYTTIFLTSANVLAQDEDPEGPPGDPGVVPINDYMPLLVMGGAILAYRFLCKEKKAV